jgi:LysM repeat protein
MAKPMTSAQLIAQLKRWGVKYVEVGSWETHNRNVAGPWSDLKGFMWHHTGADTSNPATYARNILYGGISGLPGPLCHFGLAPDGTVYLTGWGRANHAGGGDPVVLRKVIDEDYTGQLKPTKGNSNGTDGNRYFYGVEIMYSGSHKMTDAQYKTALKLSAAICDFHNWSEKSIIAHGEWSSDKWDPGYAPGKIMNMVEVRADVKAKLAVGTGGSIPPPVPKPTPIPAPTDSTYIVRVDDNLWGISRKFNVSVAALKEWNNLKSETLSINQVLKVKAPVKETDPSPVVDKPDAKSTVYTQVWETDAAEPPAGHKTEENPTWWPMSILKGIYEKVEGLEKEVAELKKKLGE